MSGLTKSFFWYVSFFTVTFLFLCLVLLVFVGHGIRTSMSVRFMRGVVMVIDTVAVIVEIYFKE